MKFQDRRAGRLELGFRVDEGIEAVAHKAGF
jgi:hypothetical protein